MFSDTTQTLAIMILTSLLLVLSTYFHFIKKQSQVAFVMLLLISIVVRLFMASVDPYLHEWDERFHALVAKHIMSHPFQPMIRLDPILPYKIEDWCCNYIWVHKQPLFLWQMAVSMFLFGINEFALRLPSVVMGTVSIYFIYDIATKWIKNIDVAYFAALLFTLSYYQLELTSGRFSLDQNDLTFAFYVTASIWAFTSYLTATKKILWAILIGLFVGCAVLNKWLPGILVFGGWGLYLLLETRYNFDLQKWKYLILAAVISIVIFAPWQLYILSAYPVESGIMYEHNKRHIFEVLEGHEGTVWYHINQMRLIYGMLLITFVPLGIYAITKNKEVDKKLSIAFFTMSIVIYAFFSILVQTKMPAFTFPVNAIVWIIISVGIVTTLNYISKANTLMAISAILLGVYTLKPWQILDYRAITNIERNKKINNTNIYKSLNSSHELNGRVVINCKSFEDVELMFYNDVNAYHWYPTEQVLDSLMQKGYKFAAFKNHTNHQLPEYIYGNSEVMIIDELIE